MCCHDQKKKHLLKMCMHIHDPKLKMLAILYDEINSLYTTPWLNIVLPVFFEQVKNWVKLTLTQQEVKEHLQKPFLHAVLLKEKNKRSRPRSVTDSDLTDGCTRSMQHFQSCTRFPWCHPHLDLIELMRPVWLIADISLWRSHTVIV